jgi:hypothetical protein
LKSKPSKQTDKQKITSLLGRLQKKVSEIWTKVEVQTETIGAREKKKNGGHNTDHFVCVERWENFGDVVVPVRQLRACKRHVHACVQNTQHSDTSICISNSRNKVEDAHL